MKIIINKQPFVDEDDSFYNENYTLISELESDENSSTVDITQMFLKAALIDGYNIKSMIQTFYDIALYEASENDYEIKED